MDETKRAFTLLPNTLGGSIALAMIIWPATAILIDLVSPVAGPVLSIDDLGLALLDYTIVVIFLISVAIWVRGTFRVAERSKWHRIFISFLALPCLGLWFVFCTLFLYPLGRIDPNF